jgi:serine/threonine protein kinase
VTCAGNNTIAALIEGAIDASAAERLEVHLDACSACRQLVADLGRGLSVLDEDRLPRPGDRLGRYAIERAVGVGGMGVVFEARDTTLDRRVAIKLVRPDSDADKHALLAEARAMAQLAHRNLATIYDVGTVRGQLYLCMEFIAGSTLGEWLAIPRTPREIVAVFIAAGRGLAYVHRRGLVHLDFKPDNVLIDRAGRAVVTDFGLAAMIGHTGRVAGTPRYMAPEQRRGGATDARADQFAFCTALAEALGSAPSWARAAIERGRSEHRADRFASMDELLAVLEAGTTRRRRRANAIGILALAVVSVIAISRPPGTVTKLVERAVARPVFERITAPAEAAAAIESDSPREPELPASNSTLQAPPQPVPRAARAPDLTATRTTPDHALSLAALAPAARDNRELACDDGSELTCAVERPACPAATTLSVSDGCWTCVDEHTCAPRGVPHACDDGSPLRCTLARPTCGDGLLPSIRGGCWQCADPFTCTARSMAAPVQVVLTERGVGANRAVGFGTGVGTGTGVRTGTANGNGSGSGLGSGVGSGAGAATCGNGFCELGEDHASCPADCCELIESDSAGEVCAPVCGNGFCEIAEDHASCPADCCVILADGGCAP